MAEEKLKRRRVESTQHNPSKEEMAAAYEEVRALVPAHEDPKTKVGLTAQPILPDVTALASDRIYKIVGLRILGYEDKDIVETLGIQQPEPYRLERKYPAAFAKAEAHALRAAERKQQYNIVRARASLSKYVPRMIEVLAEIAQDKDAKENVRRSCATDIINLSGVAYARTSVGGRDSEVKGAAKTYVQTIINQGENPDVTVDAEDVEYVEEDNS